MTNNSPPEGASPGAEHGHSPLHYTCFEIFEGWAGDDTSRLAWLLSHCLPGVRVTGGDPR